MRSPPSFSSSYEIYLIESRFTPEQRTDAEEHRQRIGKWKERLAEMQDSAEDDDAAEFQFDAAEEAYDAAVQDYEFFLTHTVTDEALEAFAKTYFTLFEKDPLIVDAFFEQQKQHGQIIAQGLTAVFEQGVDAYQSLADISSSLRRVLPKRKPPHIVDSLKALVVCGSSAIGPRSSTYPREQDMDLFLLTDLSTSQNAQVLSFISDITSCMNTLMQTLQYPTAQRKEQQESIRARVQTELPAWWTVMTELEHHKSKIDLHTPDLIAHATHSRFATESDLMKLWGPHRVLTTWGDDGQQVYHQWLERAIQYART